MTTTKPTSDDEIRADIERLERAGLLKQAHADIERLVRDGNLKPTKRRRHGRIVYVHRDVPCDDVDNEELLRILASKGTA